MNHKNIIKALLCIALSIVSSACNYQQIPVETLYSNNHCAIERQTIRRIIDAADLAQLLDAKPRNLSATKPPATSLNKIDHNKQSLLLVALGQKPSSGYRIELLQQNAVLKDSKLYLPIRLHQPAKDSFQAQIMTSPCQIFSIAKTEFDEIVLMDIANKD